MTNVPRDYVQISSGLGEAPPLNIIVLPALFEGEVKAVIELASFRHFSETHQSFLDQLMESIGIVLNTIAANMRTEGLLKQSQLLTSELQAQQEELKKTNDRLEQQANSLRRSEELLRAKQEELQRTNAELEEKAHLLSIQNMEVEAKNREVEQAKRELEEKAEQLALTSKYKSEFLANMSHELRTPLNSLLILSKLLAENPQGNLTEKQVEFARTIHHAGSDLLALINDILDLSKIESGTVTLDISETSFAALRDQMHRTFAQIAHDKKLDFAIEIDPDLPRAMYTDEKRLQQIIRNLLSNAFKFTERGEVRLRIFPARSGWSPSNEILSKAARVVAFCVEDTGIGIPRDKQGIIFEAFQQADGTTSRKYGGTGLGLSISREITRLLGGELTVESTPGEGSTFTLYLPLTFVSPTQTAPLAVGAGALTTSRPAVPDAQPAPMDDRNAIEPGDRIVFIVGDDRDTASLLLGAVRAAGCKGVVITEGGSVTAIARRLKPDAITLDLSLPDMDGLALLDLLKRDPATRHIPVHILSPDQRGLIGLSMGACGVSKKPMRIEDVRAILDRLLSRGRGPCRLLRISAGRSSYSLTDLLGNGELTVETASTVSDARRMLAGQRFDCVVVDLNEQLSGPDIDDLEALPREAPLILHAPRASHHAEAALHGFGDSVRIVRSAVELADSVALVLHRPLDKLPQETQAALQQMYRHDPLLAGRRIMVVDDDIRNIFSLVSALEERGVEACYADNGRTAIDLLRQTPEIDAILVDIMMPGMDGCEVIREIRAIAGYASLPIVAVTARAMKGDRQKCIEAGATDYVAKPVDMEHIISVLRICLRRSDRLPLSSIVEGHNVVAFPITG